MAIVFPASPSTNDTFTAGSITYKWDGDKWIGLGVTPADRLVEGSNSLEINANNDLVWTGNNLHLIDSAETTASLFINSTKKSSWQAQDNFGTILYSYDGEPLLFSTSSGASFSEKLRITTDGDVGIGENSPADRLVVQKTNASGDVAVRIKNDTLTDGDATNPTTASLYLNTSTGDFNTFYIQARRNDNDTHFGYDDPRGANHVPTMVLTNEKQVLIGTTIPNSFNGVGSTHNLIVVGETSDTDITDNSSAAITISNRDGTINNTAGLHFAREDNDGNPHYCGASIVTQFRETQVTGEYPKADLAFLTSTAANNAPSEKFRIDADGNLKHLNTTPSAFTSSNPVSVRFWGRKCMQGTVYTTTTLDGSGNGQFSLGKIWLNDDTSIELFLSICPTDNTTNKTHYAKVYLQKVRGQGMTTVTIDRQDGADGGFSVSSITAGGYGGAGGSAHGTLVNVTGGSANVVYGITAFWTGISINNMY